MRKFSGSLCLLVLAICLVSNSLGTQIKSIERFRNTEQELTGTFENAILMRTFNRTTIHLSDITVTLLSVPDVMQATDYTCGPSSLSAVLGYYQYFDWRESDLAQRAKTNDQYGTSPENLLAAIQSIGLSAQMKEGMTIADFQHYIANYEPAIILFQAWADPGTQYKNDWEDGHYVVGIGFDKDYLYFEDSWILGSIGYIPKKNFQTSDMILLEDKEKSTMGVVPQVVDSRLELIQQLHLLRKLYLRVVESLIVVLISLVVVWSEFIVLVVSFGLVIGLFWIDPADAVVPVLCMKQRR